MRRFDKKRNILKANLLAENIYMNKKLMIESVGFAELKEYLQKLANEKNLQIYNKASDFNHLRVMINSAKGVLPKDGVIAIDDFNDVNYIFVLSKDPNKAQDINNTINASGQFTCVNTRTDDILGVSLSLLKPNKKAQQATQ